MIYWKYKSILMMTALDKKKLEIKPLDFKNF